MFDIAIVGSGPAGLTFAGDMAKWGDKLQNQKQKLCAVWQ